VGFFCEVNLRLSISAQASGISFQISELASGMVDLPAQFEKGDGSSPVL